MFLFDSRSFGFAQVGVTFACDLILHGEMHHRGAESCFSTFPGTNDSSFPEKEHAISLSSLSLSIGHTLTTCAHRLHLLSE